jgi:hypothetical protein
MASGLVFGQAPVLRRWSMVLIAFSCSLVVKLQCPGADT